MHTFGLRMSKSFLLNLCTFLWSYLDVKFTFTLHIHFHLHLAFRLGAELTWLREVPDTSYGCHWARPSGLFFCSLVSHTSVTLLFIFGRPWSSASLPTQTSFCGWVGWKVSCTFFFHIALSLCIFPPCPVETMTELGVRSFQVPTNKHAGMTPWLLFFSH